MKKILLLSIFLLIFSITTLNAASLADRLAGYILLQVEENGEAWYVNTDDTKRYYMKDGTEAYSIMESFGLGITNKNLSKIPVGIEERFEDTDSDEDGLSDKLEEALKTDPFDPDSDDDGFNDGIEVRFNYNPLGPGLMVIDENLINQVLGKILLQVEENGEAWYVNPQDRKRYYMKDGEAAYQIMRFLSLGVTNNDLEQIEVGSLGGATPPTPTLAQCEDGIDNDSDGLIDFPADPDCTNSNDDNETSVINIPIVTYICADGIDNDGDGLIDTQDPGCSNAFDNDEANILVGVYACADGIDNDGDGLIDTQDPGCSNAFDNDEADVNTTPPTPTLAQCEDGVDNDSDGQIDFPADDGCSSSSDNDETDPTPTLAQCEDGIDNDSDGQIDFPADDGCSSSTDDNEIKASWITTKNNAQPIIHLTNEFGTPYKLPLSTMAWEDGLHISRDGLNLYATFLPVDFISFLLSGDTVEKLDDYRRGPDFGMDLETNPIGQDFLWYHSDILYSHRNSLSDDFQSWELSNMARSVTSEGAPYPLFTDSENIEIMTFTSNETNNQDIWFIRDTNRNPSGIGSAINNVNTQYQEDNPQLERLDESTILLFFDSMDRPGGRGSHDIWYSISTDDGITWSNPSNEISVNTTGKEHQPHLYKTNTGIWYLYYSTNQADGRSAIYRSRQLTAGDWENWAIKEIVISPGNTGGVGEPSLTANGDILFALAYENPEGTAYDRYDLDPWFLPKK